MTLRCVDTLPVSGEISPARMSRRVVLPDPLGPINTIRSPTTTLRVSSLNRVRSAYVFLMLDTLSILTCQDYHYTYRR